MQTNLYNSNGQAFDDEMIINDIDELADYVNNRYSLDYDAEVIDGALSALILTGNTHNVIFEAFTQGDQTVCGCPALKDYITANEEWAKGIIKIASLTKDRLEPGDSAIAYAVDDEVSDEMKDALNYSEDSFMKDLYLPCTAHEVDSVILNAERTLDKLHNDIARKLEKMVNKLLSTRTESTRRTQKLQRYKRHKNFEMRSDESMKREHLEQRISRLEKLLSR